MRRPTPPSRRAIAEYWCSCREAEGFLLHVDLGEPECWACGWIVEGEYDGTEEAYNKAAWLDRCHLVPHARGGTSEIENFVLLCSACHRAMPNTTDRGYAICWVRTRSHWLQRVAEQLEAALTELDETALDRVQRLSKDEADWLWKRASQIRRQECVDHFGVGFNPHTTAWTFVKALDELDAVPPVLGLKEAA